MYTRGLRVNASARRLSFDTVYPGVGALAMTPRRDGGGCSGPKTNQHDQRARPGPFAIMKQAWTWSLMSKIPSFAPSTARQSMVSEYSTRKVHLKSSQVP